MDSVFGFVGEGYAILVSDTSVARSILAYKHDEDKIRALDTHKIVAAAGPQADCSNFLEYIRANMDLYRFRSGLTHSTATAASYIRTELAKALRRAPYNVNMLLAGYDSPDGPSLYFMDYLGTSHRVNFGAHGYAGYFVSATMDAHWRPGMDVAAGLHLAAKCVQELRTRMVIGYPSFLVKIVDKDGVRVLPMEMPPTLGVPGTLPPGATPAAEAATATA